MASREGYSKEGKLFSIYEELLKCRNEDGAIWEQIRERKLTMLPHIVGRKYDDSEVRLMIYGRAVNGWEHELNSDMNFESILERLLYPSTDIKNPLDDVVDACGFEGEGRKKKYYYTSSRFWKLIKFILELYGEAEEGSWYSDQKYNWNQRLVWSNLYKIAPYGAGNPEWKFIKPQMREYVDLVKTEIEMLKPKHVLFITDINYFIPWKKEPSFEELCDKFEIVDRNYVVGVGMIGDSKILVCKRPDGFGKTDMEIKEMANQIKEAFDNIKPKFTKNEELTYAR